MNIDKYYYAIQHRHQQITTFIDYKNMILCD